MRRSAQQFALAFLALLPACAQSVLDPRNPENARAIKAFEHAWETPDEQRLAGEFTFTKPALGYNLRHWASFDLVAPARQFDLAKPISFALILSVQPLAGGPGAYLYLRNESQPPRLDDAALKAAQRKLSLHFGGGFFAGPGKYRYRFMLSDQDGRMFRKHGDFEVKSSNAASPLAPGTVVSLGAPPWNGFPADAKGGHATILIHAAPIYPRRSVTRLQPYDRYVLLSALGTLLSRGGFTSAHVIAFDLAGRRVLFDEENFDRGAMRRLRRTLEEADLGTIAYQTLASGPSPQRLAETVLMRAAEERSDRETVVFMGPAWMPSRRQQPIRPALKESLPRVHYLALVPRHLLPQDTITDIVKALKGRVYSIYEPSDFLNALRKMAAGG